MRIGILYICTGNYTVFWDGFYHSSEKNLLSEHEKYYFVFTDGQIETFGNQRVKVIYQQKLGWPLDTLFRFKIFLQVEEELKKMDYLFFFNANLCINKTIGSEILPEKVDELVVTQHPGFFSKERKEFTYETRKESKAYISPEEGDIYIAGGLNGGDSACYLQMIKDLESAIDSDYQKNIVAIWHDESHINRYILDKPFKLLPPDYLYPEGWDIPFEKNIIILNKDKFGGHDRMRGIEPIEDKSRYQKSIFNRLWHLLKK